MLQSLGGLAHALEEAQTPLLQVRCMHQQGEKKKGKKGTCSEAGCRACVH